MSLLIFSGGMDSTVLLHKERPKLAISFNYGSKHNDQEHLRAKRSCLALAIPWRRIDLRGAMKGFKSHLMSSGGEIPEGHYTNEIMKQTVVPFRNGIMLSIAVGIAESEGLDKVMMANHFGDNAVYPDCRKKFVDAFSSAAIYGTYRKIFLDSPFTDISKTDICNIGQRLGVPWEDTYSCYKGEPIQCGRCSTCFERREAFHLACITDPTEYLDETPITELIFEYTKEEVLNV